MLHIAEAELKNLGITTQDVVAAIEKGLLGVSHGNAFSAPKAVITPNDGRYMMAALAAMDDPPLLAVKTLVLNPDNPANGLPQINGLVTLLDSQSGLPRATIDGNWITAVRTAGLSAVAAKYLANPSSASLGFVGCGAQARSHLEAFSDLFPIRHIKLFGRGRSNIESLTRAARDRGMSTEHCDSGQDAIESVDLVVTSITATSDVKPFLNAEGLKIGSFVTATDLAVPWISDSLSALDKIVIDDLAQEAALSNKLCDASLIAGDLSDLSLGNLDGRQSPEDRTAFLFRGHAIADLAISVLAYQRYRNESFVTS